MTSDKKQIKVYVTDRQYEALIAAQEKSGLSASDFRRKAFKLACAKMGLDFPDDMPGIGEHNKKRDEGK